MTTAHICKNNCNAFAIQILGFESNDKNFNYKACRRKQRCLLLYPKAKATTIFNPKANR